MKRKQLIAFGAIIVIIFTACSNPFFPEKRDNGGAKVPVISVHPQGAEYIIGDEAEALSVSASAGDGGELSYQWYSNGQDSNKGGTAIPNKTDANYTPSTHVTGMMYYYVVVTNTLKGKKAAAASDTAKVTVYDIGEDIIRSAAVNITGPAKGSAPDTTATADDTGYTCGAVSWSPDHNPFQGNTRYTATVTLTVDEDCIFASTLTATINGDNAAVTNNTGEAVTLSIEFDATLDKIVTGISIKTQPTKLNYTHGNTLDLSGLVVTLTFDDGTDEDIALANFGTNISTHPANGAELHSSTNNDQPVVVHYGGLTADTNNLTVAKANPTVTWPTGLTAVYGQTLSNISLALYTNSGTGAFSWTTPSNSVGDLGTRSHNMTFTPTDTANYNTLTNTVNIIVRLVEMVSVGAGSFQMGQNGDGNTGNETPVHTVTLTGFYIGKYEVTQAQYQTVMGSLPSQLTTGTNYGRGNNYPVYYVSWYDALVFCNKLSMAEGLSPAYRMNSSTDPSAWGTVPTSDTSMWNYVEIVSGSNGYRLPTEAQWEYAAKGGPSASNPYKIYSGSDTVGEVAWYYDNNGSEGTADYGSKQVGTKTANELGLHDMIGNVSEWCWDRYGTYPSEAQADPVGASSGSDRVRRGGSWLDADYEVRSVLRSNTDPSSRGSRNGFRLLRP